MSLMQDTLRSIMAATQAQDNDGFLAHLTDASRNSSTASVPAEPRASGPT